MYIGTCQLEHDHDYTKSVVSPCRYLQHNINEKEKKINEPNRLRY